MVLYFAVAFQEQLNVMKKAGSVSETDMEKMIKLGEHQMELKTKWVKVADGLLRAAAPKKVKAEKA